jgi:redox-sensitive bicupin YhaK (pirin superfamily)
MISLRPADQRGRTRLDWLDSWHSFSFGDYYDPRAMGFRSLRVMNEDRVAPGAGFGMHGHRDMEIVTLVLSGALEHRDSLGHGEVLRPGELQRMTAGTGIRHSEVNPAAGEPTHLYQIWLLPERPGLEPGYEQRPFAPAERQGRWQLVASRDGRDGSLVIHQDAAILLASLAQGQSLTREIAPGRHAWLQVLSGGGMLGNQRLAAGDGVAVSDEAAVEFAAAGTSELLLFDLA